MKKTVLILSLILPAGIVFSCRKAPVYQEPQEIVLNVGSDDGSLEGSVETKTTAVTTMPSSLYWSGTTGSGSSQTSKWTSASGTVSSSKISTGKYQTATATSYNYYVSNAALTFAAAGTTVSATGGTSGTDVICGYTEGTTSATPSVTLNHIFARTGTITTTCDNGSLSSVSYKIVRANTSGGTSGTYNLRTGAGKTDGTGWSSQSGLTSDTALTGSSDMYLIPGTYTIKVTATYTRGDYVVTQTKSGNVTVVGGKVNNITMKWPDMGTQIVISVSLTAWGTNAVGPVNVS